MIQVGLLGATGRMGLRVRELLESEFSKKAKLIATTSQGETFERLLAADVVIDFSSPDAMVDLARAAVATPGKLPAFVVGSTGWTADQRESLMELARRTTVLQSANFSTGVLALLEILKWAAPKLKALGYTPAIVETHHVHKKDAPSGTAIAVRHAISATDPDEIPVESLRTGEVIGDHEITFQGPGDHLTLGHFAQDRSIFARGAIDVALWLAGHRAAPGLVPMEKFFQERFR